MAQPFVITIDQGTTGSRVFLINREGKILASAYEEFTQYFPKPGWVEHDATEIYHGVVKLLGMALEKAGVSAKDAVGIGITNQRETTVVWEKESGEPIHPAIVWQCRRTANFCEELKARGFADKFQDKTGLVIDAYFSGTKIKYILDHVEKARQRAKQREILFGTIDSYLLYRLTNGHSHKTDFTNASRTLIFNIHDKKWDLELLDILNIPEEILPEVENSSAVFGYTEKVPHLPDGLPIYSLIGDQQAALYGQLCHRPGELKNTYGTGCFLVMNLGQKPLKSKQGLITTLACDEMGKPVYALEGSIFIGGAVMQWLRDKLQFFSDSAHSEKMAEDVPIEDEVVFVPAFAGLGAPYWEQRARGAIFGLTRDTTREQITRAALKSIALQSYDVIEAMEKDSGFKIPELKVDGGATKNNYLMKYQAGILGKKVIRPQNPETTVLGAAYLAGLAAKFWVSPKELEKLNPPEKEFLPEMPKEVRERELALWQKAIRRVLIV